MIDFTGTGKVCGQEERKRETDRVGALRREEGIKYRMMYLDYFGNRAIEQNNRSASECRFSS